MDARQRIMKYDSFKHHRRSIRLKGYDYTQAGVYFVTICVAQRECLFGEIVDGEMRLNEYGRIVAEEWARTATMRSNVELGEFVVMPNHAHGIIVLTDNDVGARRRLAPTTEQFGKPIAGSLPTIIRAFKSAVTYRINILRQTSGAPVWQRNYWEHIIRNERELERIRAYIINNPANWSIDEENPSSMCKGETHRV